MLTKNKTIFYPFPPPPSHLRQDLPFFIYKKKHYLTILLFNPPCFTKQYNESGKLAYFEKIRENLSRVGEKLPSSPLTGVNSPD